MTIQMRCPKCHELYGAKDEHAGKKFKCKQCGAVFTAPSLKRTKPPQSPELGKKVGESSSGGGMGGGRQESNQSPGDVADAKAVQTAAEQALDAVLAFRDATAQMPKQPPLEHGCYFGCLSALGFCLLLAPIAFLVEGQASEGGALGFAAILLSLAGGYAVFVIKRKRIRAGLKAQQNEIEAMAKQTCERHPVILQHIENPGDLTDEARYDALRATLRQLRQSSGRATCSDQAPDEMPPDTAFGDKVPEQSVRQAFDAILEIRREKVKLPERHPLAEAGCAGFLIAFVVWIALVLLICAFLPHLDESEVFDRFMILILSVSLLSGIVTYWIVKKKRLAQFQDDTKDLTALTTMAYKKHTIIAQHIDRPEDLIDTTQCDALVAILQQELLKTTKPRSVPRHPASYPQSEGKAWGTTKTYGAPATGRYRRDRSSGSSPLDRRVLYRIEVFEGDPAPVLPPVCVITDDDADETIPIQAFMWKVIVVPPVFVLWTLRREEVMLPFSRHGYKLYQDAMPSYCRFVEGGFRVCCAIPLIPVDLAWWIIIAALLPLNIVFEQKKRRLCAAHWNRGSRQFSVSVSSARFAREFQRLNPWAKVSETKTKSAGITPF